MGVNGAVAFRNHFVGNGAVITCFLRIVVVTGAVV